MIDITISIMALIAGGVTMELFTAGIARSSEENQIIPDTDALRLGEEYLSGNPS